MKKAIAIVLVSMAILCAVTAICGFRPAKTYTLNARVTYIEWDSDTFTVTDENGELWDLNGIEDWMLGDHVRLVIDSNDTASVEDDVILSATYTG